LKAVETNLLTLLKRNETQFIVPIYQRTYSWTLEQCKQLWADIMRIAQGKPTDTHFVGSIVYIEQGHQTATSVDKYLVIDGQQRLTTLSILLAALGKAIETNPGQGSETSRQRIKNVYLTNPEEKDDLRHKLILTRSDRETFIALVEDREVPADASQRIIANYEFFDDCIRRSEISFDALFNAVGRLIIVDVSLERVKDNPQLIFESLNSTGLDLAQADLIRNYLLMDLEPNEQRELYENYWYRMERSFENGYATQFDRFMRDYLTIKNKGKIPNINRIYVDFKTYAQSARANGIGIEDLVADIYQYAKYFVRMVFLKEVDPEIRRVFSDLKDLQVEVAAPFMMEVYDDYERQKRLSQPEFLEILRLVESYVFRRIICGIPTNSLNKTFAQLSRDADKANYLASVRSLFMAKDSYRRFPRNEEFVREFLMKDIYNLRLRLYILGRLENYQRTKEVINPHEYSIEHIMPQNPNLSAHWQQMLGENWAQIQQTYLHTIGNLTLTGFNAEMSDKPFEQKRDADKGFANSPLYLNQDLRHLSVWSDTQIVERGERLVVLASEVWTIPEESQYPKLTTVFSNDSEVTYSLDSYSFSDESLALFHALNALLLDLDTSVRREFTKLYIAYKSLTNFVDVVPQKKRLLLTLNMEFSELDDPQGICEDMSNVGKWGNGSVQLGVSSLPDMDYAMFLVRQSFEENSE